VEGNKANGSKSSQQPSYVPSENILRDAEAREWKRGLPHPMVYHRSGSSGLDWHHNSEAVDGELICLRGYFSEEYDFPVKIDLA
jgi:hypothetical protein